MLRTRCTVGVTVGLAASKQGRSSLGVSCRGYDFAVMRAPAHKTQPGVCPWAARSRTCEHIVRVWTRLAHSNLGPALPSVCPSAVDHHSFFSSQCRCGLGRSTRSRWHQPRRAVQPGRLLCSRSRFLALSMLPLFAPQGTWDGTVPCSARVGPAARWGRWAGCPGNVAPRFACAAIQVEATSHRRLATGRNSRLLQEFIWPCSLRIIQGQGAPSPMLSPHAPWPPIAKLPWGPHTPFSNPTPTASLPPSPRTCICPCTCGRPRREVPGYRGIQQELRETSLLPSSQVDLQGPGAGTWWRHLVEGPSVL